MPSKREMRELESQLPTGLEQFEELCEDLNDPRRSTHINYPLKEVLFLCICSIVSGFESNRAIQTFGDEKLEWLRKYFPYKKGIPHHETIGDVIGFIEKQSFEIAFIDWVKSCFGSESSLLIHIDGKRLSNSVPRMLQDKKSEEGGQRPEAIVNAYASDTGIVIAHNSIGDHGDERRGAKEIIDQLSIENAIITGDSNFCDKDILKRIQKKKGHYIMALKRNNPILHDLAEQYFGDVRIDKMPFHTEDHGHGRKELRTYHSIKVDELPDQKLKEYAGLCRIVRVRRQRTIKCKDKTTDEVQYYITDLDRPVQELAYAIRSHWQVENSLHWVLDTGFGEDQSTKRSGNQAANFSLIKKMALNAINTNRGNKSVKATRMRCALSDRAREDILELS